MNKPQIRFKGFDDEWQHHSLSELGEVKMCKRILKSQTSAKGEVPFFKIGTFGKKPDAFISRELFDEYKRLYSYPKIGDIIVSAAGTIGRTSVYDGKPAYFQDSNLIWIDNDNSIIDNSFLAVAYPRVKWAVSSTTIARIYNETVRQTKTSAPSSIKEQQEIGNYFRQLDEIITEVEREISRLEKMKQASLPKMFPRLGATTPEIRFAGFSEPWEDRRLDSLSTIFGRIGFRGYAVADIVPKGMGAISLSPTNLIGTNSVQYNTQTTYISNSKYLESPEIMIFPGDVVFVKTASVGRVAYIDHIICDTTLNPQLVVLKKLSCNGRFLSLAMATSEFQDKILGIAGGGVLKTLSQIKLGELTVKMPSLKEQNAIGEYFRNLDALISTKRQKFTKLRNIKQACLDKMFINTSEL